MRLVRRAAPLGCILFLLILLAGCFPSGGATPAPGVSPIATGEGPGPTAAAPPGGMAVSPLATAPAPGPASTSIPGTGSLAATLRRFDGTPLIGILIYPAYIDAPEGIKVAGVDPLSDPHSETDAAGQVAVPNLVPGEYVLVAQSPVGLIMPHNREGAPVRFEVEAGKVTNLGELEIGYNYPDSR